MSRSERKMASREKNHIRLVWGPNLIVENTRQSRNDTLMTVFERYDSQNHDI